MSSPQNIEDNVKLIEKSEEKKNEEKIPQEEEEEKKAAPPQKEVVTIDLLDDDGEDDDNNQNVAAVASKPQTILDYYPQNHLPPPPMYNNNMQMNPPPPHHHLSQHTSHFNHHAPHAPPPPHFNHHHHHHHHPAPNPGNFYPPHPFMNQMQAQQAPQNPAPNHLNLHAAPNFHHPQHPQQQQQQQSIFSTNSSNLHHSATFRVEAMIEYRKKVTYVQFPPGFQPLWNRMYPYTRLESTSMYSMNRSYKSRYKLTLLSVSEFTVQGVAADLYGRAPPSVTWMRRDIKRISAPHGKAVFERMSDFNDDWDDSTGNIEGSTEDKWSSVYIDKGRWRIPMGAYQPFFSWLSSHNDFHVTGIPPHQLKIASLGKEKMDRKYPSPKRLIKLGVPRGLSLSLAPYQRGGVDFVYGCNGNALIADEMGLGKTIQSIAAMTMYASEWPLLVLCPSAARYHWEAEIKNWIGKNARVNQKSTLFLLYKKAKLNENDNSDDDDDIIDKDGDDEKDNNMNPYEIDMESIEFKDWHLSRKRKRDTTKSTTTSTSTKPKYMNLLKSEEIHVVSNSKDLWNRSSRVIILSYDLAVRLAQAGKLNCGQFKCIIVDESHMLKELKSKRTTTIIPILHSAKRCVLLSGTPAFARPLEIFPQINAISKRITDENNQEIKIWMNHDEFRAKYCSAKKSGIGGKNLSELHTLLTSTVMIRRRKADMLKALPPKMRELALIPMIDKSHRSEISSLMKELKASKGTLGKIMKRHNMSGHDDGDEDNLETITRANSALTTEGVPKEIEEIVKKEIEAEYEEGMKKIRKKLKKKINTDDSSDSDDEEAKTIAAVRKQMISELQNRLKEMKEKRVNELIHEAFIKKVKENQEKAAAAAAAAAEAEAKEDKSSSSAGNTADMKDPPPEDPTKRKNMLGRLSYLTGLAKVPVIVSMLKTFVQDPSNGKLCIFAHHIDVLDEIMEGCGLPNSTHVNPKSMQSSYIRIDGSTSPKLRQTLIDKFQNEPCVRVAFLGITAVGVAVTLTAASTVWFAELFWSPSIMLQAEDRLHRIGQQATVKCVYLIGKGSLDEVVWKLIEMKFRSLGEFVEGKAISITVHKDGRNLSGNSNSKNDNDDGDDDASSSSDDDDEEDEVIQVDDVANEITELANQEQAELNNLVGKSSDDSSSRAAKESESSSKVGTTEDSAICLSGDENEEEEGEEKNQTKTPTASIDNKMSLYKMMFIGSSYELTLVEINGRLVVHAISQSRLDSLGAETKPHVGDIVVGLNGNILPFPLKFHEGIGMLKKAKANGNSVELLFCEYYAFHKHFREVVVPKLAEKRAKQQKEASSATRENSNNNNNNSQPVDQQHVQAVAASSANSKPDEPIEILDDD